MDNPFAYSNYVSGDSFCNRKKEIAEMLKYIKGSQNVLLYSHRRYGKSSLIRQIFREIKKKKLKIGVMHVELYGTISEKDFITKTFQGLSQLESNFEKLLQSVNRTLKSIRLNMIGLVVPCSILLWWSMMLAMASDRGRVARWGVRKLLNLG